MRETRTSGSMSGEGKRGRWPSLNATAPFLDSTHISRLDGTETGAPRRR